ncbi:hypothetical protein MKP07_03025 [Niabella hibiscisoli]|nr:hypothetical protein [Niabella hibiscisoli]MCH5715232.1 hypothetical protein [Niabella hibiscisoli]
MFAAGANIVGPLGLAGTEARLVPEPVTGSVKAVGCGYLHSVILKTNGKMYTTGSNRYGQLGLGDAEYRTAFTLIPDFE